MSRVLRFLFVIWTLLKSGLRINDSIDVLQDDVHCRQIESDSAVPVVPVVESVVKRVFGQKVAQNVKRLLSRVSHALVQRVFEFLQKKENGKVLLPEVVAQRETHFRQRMVERYVVLVRRHDGQRRESQFRNDDIS